MHLTRAGYWLHWVASREDEQARLHSLTKSGRVATLLAVLAAHLRRQLIEFVVEAVAVRSRGG